jgi:2-aminobenzoate-CoA ligase
MIISSGYNIAAIEVESVLLTHEEILECAVIGLPDVERGMLVCARIKRAT